MDLLCCEQTTTENIKAYDDPVLLKDRVLKNLLKTEDRYTLACTTFSKVQYEVTPEMRKMVAEWMMEVRYFCKLGLPLFSVLCIGFLPKGSW